MEEGAGNGIPYLSVWPSLRHAGKFPTLQFRKASSGHILKGPNFSYFPWDAHIRNFNRQRSSAGSATAVRGCKGGVLHTEFQSVLSLSPDILYIKTIVLKSH